MKPNVKLLVQWCVIVLVYNADAIDPVGKIGYCKRLALPADDSLIYANEGVWFPQYRSAAKGVKDFSCHTLYDDIYRSHEDNELALRQKSYFTIRGEADQNPKTIVLDQTDERGIYKIEEFLTGYGMATKYHIMLKITPDIRLRYVCTNATEVRHDFDSIFIETRRLFARHSDIMEAVKILNKSGLKGKLVRIKQNNCTRPLSSAGYDESLFFDES